MARVLKLTDPETSAIAPYEHGVLEAAVPHGPSVDPEHEVVEDSLSVEDERAAIMTRARAEAEEIVKAAYEEGLQRGIEAGRAEFVQSTGEAADALRSAAASMVEARQAFLASTESEILRLSGAVAEKILQREARQDPEIVRTTVREALNHITDRERLIFRVNPDDLKVLEKEGLGLLDGLSGLERAEIVADAAIGSGGCVVESEKLVVDAQLKTQLDRIVQKILE